MSPEISFLIFLVIIELKRIYILRLHFRITLRNIERIVNIYKRITPRNRGGEFSC